MNRFMIAVTVQKFTGAARTKASLASSASNTKTDGHTTGDNARQGHGGAQAG
jgi:hypothetical protein